MDQIGENRSRLVKRISYCAILLLSALFLWKLQKTDQPAAEEGAIVSPVLRTKTCDSVPGGNRPKVEAAGGKGVVVSNGEISPAALRLGQATQEVNMTYEEAAKFGPQDVAYLNMCYRTQTNLSDRGELTRWLGVVGNEETVQLFIKCLTEEQAGKRFMEEVEDPNREPELVLWTTLTSLGLLAASHDSAFAFLKGTVRPEFWRETINWKSRLGHESVGLMTNWAIQALGNTGRQEAREVLVGLMQNPPTPWPPGVPKNQQRTFDGAIISAAYMLDRIEMVGGTEKFKAGVGPSIMTGFAEWRSSEKAKPWLKAK